MPLFQNGFPRLLCALVLVLASQPALADKFSDMQSSYSRIASGCGDDPGSPSYSDADYAQALADAAKGLKSATKSGVKAQIEAINKAVTRVQECMKEELRKFKLPTIKNCPDFLYAYENFAKWSELAIVKGHITPKDRDRMRGEFRPSAMACIRTLMEHCIDPTDTKTIDHVIDVARAASGFGFIKSYASATGWVQAKLALDPRILKMTFCTDTDYSCKGDKARCDWRIASIKAVMQTYMED